MLENHTAVSLYFMYYNFVRIHQTLRVTPALAAGVTERLWDINEVIKLLEEYRADLAEEKKAENRRRNRAVLQRARGCAWRKGH